MGYIGKRDTLAAQHRPDPKDQIVIINQMTEVGRLSARGQVDRALELAKQVAAQCEGYEQPMHFVAYLYARLGRGAEAVKVLENYARRYPSADVFIHLADNLKALKRYDAFERALQAAEAIEVDGRGSIPMMRGDLFFEQGRYAEAVEQYQKAVDIDAQRLGPAIEHKLEQARAKLRGQ